MLLLEMQPLYHVVNERSICMKYNCHIGIIPTQDKDTYGKGKGSFFN